MHPVRSLLLLSFLLASPALAGDVKVIARRVPDGGIQPQVAVDARGVVHLIYLKGDPAGCDVYYTRSSDDGATWAKPIRVNSQPGSAIAIGTVRGANLALGRNGRIHVAWMGAQKAQPRAPGGATPMLYTRLSDDRTAFEPQRNVIRQHPGLDGGGSIAGDDRGNVFIAWHAPATQGAGEQDRRVWVARSADDGQTFAPEKQVSDTVTGACGCCGMRAFAADGKLFVLYRGAAHQVDRPMYLVQVDPDLNSHTSRDVAPMNVGICVMSTSAFAPSPRGILAAWELKDGVEWALVRPGKPNLIEPQTSPGDPHGRKHPAVAGNDRGQVLLAWAQGTGWNKGGAVRWQVFDQARQPIAGSSGTAPDLPVWDAPAAFTGREGFIVLY